MSTDISELEEVGKVIEQIPVQINYDIIRLFSEGLYRSPHKAIEELVSNSYDAEARNVHVLLPEETDHSAPSMAPLWVIDDGGGMDLAGFQQLWRIAESAKADLQPPRGKRLPIGQFGIGKLAAYVLAYRLTHISRVQGNILLTAMNFRDVAGPHGAGAPLKQISLREISEEDAKQYLAEIEFRDPQAWDLMFGSSSAASSWTAAALSDFRDLYDKLVGGRLRWVLSTSLPLHADFSIVLNGERVESSKENIPLIKTIRFDRKLSGIGKVEGKASIYEKSLATGKAKEIGRSHGFFIRVRERIINLEDQLFGVQPLNHAAWARFALEVRAEGLRDHLLSSREGVKDSVEIEEFRNYLHEIFNQCRVAYEEWIRQQDEDMDLEDIFSKRWSAQFVEPLARSVETTAKAGSESFYIGVPKDVVEHDLDTWLEEYEDKIAEQPFEDTKFINEGVYAPPLRYDPSTRDLEVNSDHPFVDKLTNGGQHKMPAKLFAISEVLLEGQLQSYGMDPTAISGMLRDRDRVLRLTAGDAPPTAKEVLRILALANQSSEKLEKATGALFQALGFEYERKGGSAPGPDGILYAHLGRHADKFADYKLVYDTKQTDHPSVPADKVNLASMADFIQQAGADYGFFIASAYQAEEAANGKLNRLLTQDGGKRVTLLKIDHLKRLAQLHYQYGVTLSKLYMLFESARTVTQVNEWLDALEEELQKMVEVPIQFILQSLEAEKSDKLAIPSIDAIRAKHVELKKYSPEHLAARLSAQADIVGPRWLEVRKESREVLMHHTADQILAEIERHTHELDLAFTDESAKTTA